MKERTLPEHPKRKVSVSKSSQHRIHSQVFFWGFQPHLMALLSWRWFSGHHTMDGKYWPLQDNKWLCIGKYSNPSVVKYGQIIWLPSSNTLYIITSPGKRSNNKRHKEPCHKPCHEVSLLSLRHIAKCEIAKITHLLMIESIVSLCLQEKHIFSKIKNLIIHKRPKAIRSIQTLSFLLP